MALGDELERIGAVAAGLAAPGEWLAGILAAEPGSGRRAYVCAYESREGRSWLVLDDGGQPLADRAAVRDAASIAAMVEIAADTAAGGALEELRGQLVALRLRESPPGIEEAEQAALELERTLGAPPRLATPALLDDIGAATRRLELSLGDDLASPFAEAMRTATAAVAELLREIEANYKVTLR